MDILKKWGSRCGELDNRCIGDEMEGQLGTLMEKIKLLITVNNEEFYTEAKNENSSEEKIEKNSTEERNKNSSEQLNKLQSNDGNSLLWIKILGGIGLIGGFGIFLHNKSK